ncbi:MAG: single-stranded-DNA-specific exonuclease RecJ [Oscillospiraceae bacterium]|nr:single-stranded-DNA-specific exonuclease RecJ [Oscillospiraceae bacterium]
MAAGFSPLTAAALCSRRHRDPAEAAAFLSPDQPLPDPFLLRDMDRAARRVRQAVRRGERLAVFGDYDVDGITATCLMVQFLRALGADCLFYIPGRIEEGYGLSRGAIEQLCAQGVRLIVTVDCGITALEEAAYCRELGVELIITDHHECKDGLPEAVAVVDPHRPGDAYPHRDLAGVGVAFKLAAAICGDQEAVLNAYCDLVCLGTVADVMPLLGENRAFVDRGLQRIAQAPGPGLAALMRQCGCDRAALTAGTIGYVLAPRINAAGRMGEVYTAVELFLTGDAQRAETLAESLCQLNRRRQAVEAEIYDQAVAMLEGETDPAAIVLADERWHQGVVGIVASRLAEEYRCPAFLICLDGERGKASSRSYGGFNLFSALESLEGLLESYGGHELAAGFTIGRAQIPAFRAAVREQAGAFRASDQCRSALEIDCEIDPALLTLPNVEGLDQLEPCGPGCPRPVFAAGDLLVEQLSVVGGGRHLRLRLRREEHVLQAIFFSASILRAAVSPGDLVELAFTPQINEFRGVRSVQLNVVDIRSAAEAGQYARERDLYARHCAGGLTAQEAAMLLPQRPEFVAVWRYLASHSQCGELEDECGCMSRKISRYAGIPASFVRTQICLDVFAEQGLISLRQTGRTIHITLTSGGRKADLDASRILMRLKQQKAGD